MTTALHRLVYVSQNLILGGDETIREEIAQILRVSQRNNQAAGVTGALMFNAGCFTQILEGESSAITQVFERIQRDERHSDVVVLEFEPTQSRDFADWSMGFVGKDDEPVAALKDLVAAQSFDPSKISTREIYQTVFDLMRDENPVYA